MRAGVMLLLLTRCRLIRRALHAAIIMIRYYVISRHYAAYAMPLRYVMP